MTLLPKNATTQEKAIEGSISRMLPVVIGDMWNAETCHDSLLPWLAWALSVDNWSNDWAEKDKREAIKLAIQIHKKKGTVGSIKNIIATSGVSASVVEWWQQTPKRPPYTFSVFISTDDAATTASQKFIIDQVKSTKPVRCQFDVNLSTKIMGRFGFVGAVIPVLYYQYSMVVA